MFVKVTNIFQKESAFEKRTFVMKEQHWKNGDIKIDNENFVSQGCKDNYKKLLFKGTPKASWGGYSTLKYHVLKYTFDVLCCLGN